MRLAPFATAVAYGNRRLTRLEIGLYATGAAILLAIFADKALDYMELAERTAMYTTVGVITSSVNARIAADMLRGAAKPAGTFTGADPFALELRPTQNGGIL